MKKILLLLLLPVFTTVSNAQDDVYNHRGISREIILNSRMIGDEISITATKTKPGFYSICIEFEKGRGAIVRDVFKVIDTPDTELIRFKRDSVYGAPGFTHSYYPGAVNSKVKHDFTYRLPYADGESKRVRVTRHDYSDKHANNHKSRTEYIFIANEGDDIYAMRKGTVTRVEEAEWYLEGAADNKTLRKANKTAYVEHADGTVAQYHNIQEGTTTVEPGDIVYPDKVIGKAGSLNDERYEIRVTVNYATCPMRGMIPDFHKVEFHYLEPCFSTPDGAVRLKEDDRPVCKAAEDLITAEMTKRQKKERSKKK